MSIFLHRTKQFIFYGSYCLQFKLQLFFKFVGYFYVLLDLIAWFYGAVVYSD